MLRNRLTLISYRRLFETKVVERKYCVLKCPSSDASCSGYSTRVVRLMTAPMLIGAALTGQVDARTLGSGSSLGRRLGDHAIAPAPVPLLPFASFTNQNVTGFIKPRNTKFVIDGLPYTWGGTNDFSIAQVNLYTAEEVGEMMRAHAQQGARVIRFFAFSNGDGAGSVPTPQPIQPQVGTFDETALQRLDLVIAEAAKNGMRVIMPLVNYEPALGGMQWYVDNILGAGQDKEVFYTDPQVRAAYRNYVALLVNRVNTVTGIAYKNDPAIAAWELSNEAHTSDLYEKTRNLPPGLICNTWLLEMSAYIKGLGIAQMVSTGEEGYRADGDTSCCDNSWIDGGFKGIDFVADIQLPNIDFATIHYYPDNWMIGPQTYINYSQYFLSSRASIAHAAGKPIILEESGLGGLNGFTGVDRDTFLSNIYDIAQQKGFAGQMIWQVWPVGTPNLEGYNFAYDQSGGRAVTTMYAAMAAAA